jgi:gliding motility-associated-like protein
VLSCNTPPPLLPSILTCPVTGGIDSIINGQHVMTVCPGTQLSFCISGSTATTTNTMFARMNLASYNLSGPATFTSTPPANTATGTFTWTPALSGNYAMVIEFVDSTCVPGQQPIVLKSYFNFLVKVLPGVSAGGPYNYCPGGAPLQLQATGPQGTTSYTWATVPGQVGLPQANISNLLIANPTAVPNTTVDVFVTGLPIVSGCPNKDTVTLNVFLPLVVNAGPDKSPCANDQINIAATTNRAPGTLTSIQWLPNTFLSTPSALSTNCTPLQNTTYVLNITDQYGCKGTDTMNVLLAGVRPIIGAYASRDTVCKGEQVKLYANASAQPCGLSSFPCQGTSSNVAIGTGTIANGQFSPFYRDFYQGYRAQFMYRADELKAAGMSPGNIKGLTFKTQSAPSNGGTDSLLGFKIKLGCTPANDLNTTTGFVSGLTQVFSANKFGPTLGNNVINLPLASTYFWDGKSNLVVDVCYDLPSFIGAQPCPVFSSPTPFNSVLVDQDFSNSGCFLTGTTASFYSAQSSIRPNISFNYCKADPFAYNWAPTASFGDATLENPTVNAGVIQGPTNTFTVTVVSGANGVCNGTKSLTVAVDNSGGVDATANSAHLCEPGLTTLQGTPTANTAPPSYQCGEENFTTSGAAVNYTIGTQTLTNGAPFSSQVNGKTQILYTAADLATAGIQKGRIESIGFNVTSKNTSTPYAMSVAMSCTKDNLLTNFVNIGNTKTVYSGNINTVLGWNTINLSTPFLWDGTSNLVIDLCYSNFNDPNFSPDYVASSAFAASYLYSEYSNAGDGCAIPLQGGNFNNWNSTPTYRPNLQLRVTPVQNKPFQYVWNPSLFVYDTTKGQTLAYVTQNTIYTVSLINKTGCKINDTVHVKIETHDVTVTPTDTSICGGDKVQLMATESGSSLLPANFLWIPNYRLTSLADTSVLVDPKVTTTYSVIRTDEFGCKDTATSRVVVLSDPQVTILNTSDTLLVPYGNTVNLVATGAHLYSWTPVWATSNSTTNNILLDPKEDGMYYVYGIDTNGCKNYDSVWIKIDNTNPVSIPSAFSPNGDGNNDLFRVANYNFERVQEFRVFDRFGTEVFTGSTNDGWDGTFRGQKLEMDTYMYLIRLAYPDGSVKVFKGDVLLLK